MQKEKRIKTINSIFWRFFERCGAQGVTFAVTIILARILEPSVYGEIAVITVFTNILQVFVDSGLGSALIQKKDSDDEDFSTVFCFNIIIYSAILDGAKDCEFLQTVPFDIGYKD